jgi:hypothetical protein
MDYRNGIWFRILAPTFIYAACVLPYPAAHANEATVYLQIAQAGAPKGTPLTIRGKISAIDGPNLKVTTTSGEVLVRLPENVRIGGVACGATFRYHRWQLRGNNRYEASRRQPKSS